MFEVQDFVEEYNQLIDWNIEFRKEIDTSWLESKADAVKLLDGFFSTEKITPEGYDLENAKVFKYEDTGRYELQAYSKSTYHTIYFWCTPFMTKEEYINGQIEFIKEEIKKIREESIVTISNLRDKVNVMDDMNGKLFVYNYKHKNQ